MTGDSPEASSATIPADPPRRLLQICPHDTAPFGALCAHYAKAARSIGVATTTVYLAPADAQPLADADYLDADDLGDTQALVRALQPYAQQSWDLVLCHRYRAYWSVAKSRLSRNPCVALAHEYGMLRRWQRRLNRRISAHNVRFAGVAPEVTRQLHEVTGNALLMTNAIDVDEAEPQLLDRDAALEAMGLTPGPYTVGVVGRLHYKKRPALALRAFEQFAQQHPDARLVFVGDGPERGRLEQQSNEQVHILGPLPNAARYCKAFDVLLHTASAEPFGMVVLEAMFAGIPVVALDDHGPGYILQEQGFYADSDTASGYAQALQQAAEADNSELLISGPRRVRQQFSIASMARVLDALMQDVDVVLSTDADSQSA